MVEDLKPSYSLPEQTFFYPGATPQLGLNIKFYALLHAVK
jgi:hypothetical protein